jgi:L-threonylcarbamoyladenylate synthase
VETKSLHTHTPAALAAAVDAAVAALQNGDPVALPTETVYGLAADALLTDAVLKIFEAKERPFFDPLIVHLPNREWLERVANIPEESRALVEALIARFWPGPLTLVLPRRQIVPDLVTAGLETVAVRMSAHPVFSRVAQRLGKPLAAPSANRFGRISPTTAAHVRSELAGRIPLIVDGGPTKHGIESTILSVEGARLRLLRAGPVTPEEIAATQMKLRQVHGSGAVADQDSEFLLRVEEALLLKPQAPGQLKSHYAPRTPLALVDDSAEWTAERAGLRCGLLGMTPRQDADYARFAHVEWLSPSGDLREAAAALFASLRRLDEAGLDAIVAERIAEEGLGIAIMDRLRKASHRDRI